MRVLITRPMEDAEPLARSLAVGGVGAMIEPLLEINYLQGALPDLSKMQGVLATSANGIRAFSRVSDNRHIKIWAVGDATARSARDAGFDTVMSAGGDVDALAALVIAQTNPSLGPLLHVAGSRLAGDLGAMLEAAGFVYNRSVLYEARTLTELSPGLCDAFQANTLDGIVLFSPRTAKTLVRLIEKHGLAAQLSKVTVFCLSKAVAQKVEALDWKKVIIATIPQEDALIDTIFSTATQS